MSWAVLGLLIVSIADEWALFLEEEHEQYEKELDDRNSPY